jgi:hypothetical protein
LRKIAAVILALATLSLLPGCNPLPTVNLQSQVNLNTLQGVVAGYGILVNQENVLKAQPLCKTGTAPSLTNICVPRSIIVRLQNTTKVANLAVNNAVNFVDQHPTVDPTQYISAASSALLAVQSVYNAAANQANAATGG